MDTTCLPRIGTWYKTGAAVEATLLTTGATVAALPEAAAKNPVGAAIPMKARAPVVSALRTVPSLPDHQSPGCAALRLPGSCPVHRSIVQLSESVTSETRPSHGRPVFVTGPPGGNHLREAKQGLIRDRGAGRGPFRPRCCAAPQPCRPRR